MSKPTVPYAQSPLETQEDIQRALDFFRLRDTERDEGLDQLTRLAQLLCGTPSALITILDGDCQRIRSSAGTLPMDVIIPIEESLCAYAVQEPKPVTIYDDLAKDDRFSDNPAVVNRLGIKAYIGASLLMSNGIAIGTICALDVKPRRFSPNQVEGLQILSKQAVRLFELRRQVIELERNHTILQSLNTQLDQFAYIISHDLKAPIRHQSSFAQIIKEDFGNDLSKEINSYLQKIIEAGGRAQEIIADLSEYVHTVQTAFGTRHDFSTKELLNQVVMLANVPPTIAVKSEVQGVDGVHANATALRHILVNLVSNAAKFNHRAKGAISINVFKTESDTSFVVKDDGPGLSESDQIRIFQIFGRGSNAVDKPGRGLGLAIAAKLTQNLGGTLVVDSTLGDGATFTVTIPQM